MAEFQEALQSILSNQAAMGQIMALANSLSGGGEPVREESPPSPPPPPPSQSDLPDLGSLLGQVDPGLLRLGMDLLRESQNKDDRNAALLAALRPFLKEDRRARLDRALQIARVTRLIRVGLTAMGERGEDHV